MNLLVISVVEFPEEFPWEQFTATYVADTGTLADYSIDAAERSLTHLVTASPDEIPESLLNVAASFIEVEDPIAYVVSRGIPGDVAVMAYSDTEEDYEVLERLNKAGITVMDPQEEWIEVVIDKTVHIEDVIDAIAERVTADVLRILRAEQDTPNRRGRFRSPAPRL